MKLKICGMTDPENLLRISKLKPDYLGFIFYKHSPRYFEGSIPQIPTFIKKVGVFVDAPELEIFQRVDQHKLDVVQLHGSENPEVCEALQARGVEVIKVFSVGNTFDFSKLEPYESVVDYFLFDTRGKAPGGNGITFNWEVLKSYPSTVPFFLSGGIGLSEADSIEELQHWFQQRGMSSILAGIDLNSRFESAPGIKNQQELKKFLQLLNPVFKRSIDTKKQ